MIGSVVKGFNLNLSKHLYKGLSLPLFQEGHLSFTDLVKSA